MLGIVNNYYERVLMKNKVIVINGSPRKNGNSRLIANSFMLGLKESGHTVKEFDVIGKGIKGCLACDKCWSKNRPCIQTNDSFNELAALIEESTLVVFVTPLYWGSFSGQLKQVIDRLYAYTMPHSKKNLDGKKCVLIASGAYDTVAFEGLNRHFFDISMYLDWQIVNQLLAPNLQHAGEVSETLVLNKAFEMGNNLYNSYNSERKAILKVEKSEGQAEHFETD